MKRLACLLFGHRTLVKRVLPESASVHYGVEERDAWGRALTWPTCPRCGWMLFYRIEAERLPDEERRW